MSEQSEIFSNKERKSKNGTGKDTEEQQFIFGNKPGTQKFVISLFIQLRELLIEKIFAPAVSLMVIWKSH
jgi:hypothetical protein